MRSVSLLQLFVLHFSCLGFVLSAFFVLLGFCFLADWLFFWLFEFHVCMHSCCRLNISLLSACAGIFLLVLPAVVSHIVLSRCVLCYSCFCYISHIDPRYIFAFREPPPSLDLFQASRFQVSSSGVSFVLSSLLVLHYIYIVIIIKIINGCICLVLCRL